MKQLLVLFLCFYVTVCSAVDDSYKLKLKNRFATQAQEVFFRYTIQEADKIPPFKIPHVSEKEIDDYLVENFSTIYDGYNTSIHQYIQFFTSLPQQHLRVWFGLMNETGDLFHQNLSEQNVILKSLAFSQGLLLSHIKEDGCYPPFLIHAPLAMYYGVYIDSHRDERADFQKNCRVANLYWNDLQTSFSRKSNALGAFVLGSATVQKALLQSEDDSYWSIYPHLKSEYRDFYPAFLATLFLLSKQKEWGIKAYDFESRSTKEHIAISDTLHFEQIAYGLNWNVKQLSVINAQYFNDIVYPSDLFIIPTELKEVFQLNKDTIYNYKRDDFFPVQIDSCYIFYRTKTGDYYRDLTKWFGVGLEEIKRLNGFTTNTLKTDWDVFFRVPCVDSALYASYDELSRNQKNGLTKDVEYVEISEKAIEKAVENKKVSEKETPSGKKITYTIKSGDSLWLIGQKYKVSDKDIMEWNGIDERIQPGQKIIIYLP
jgi:membrane-bound lytic murein transglycosylase D